jgi:UDP-glucose 4-epimerase
VRAALSEGYRVRTLTRHTPGIDVLPAGVQVRTGDISDSDAVGRALEGVGVVIHLAALLHVVGPSDEIRTQYQRVNADATAKLLRQAVQAGVKRFVFCSTVAVYGNHADRQVDEDTVPNPDTEYARTKLRAEEAVLSEVGSDGQPVGVVLRLAAVYGPRVQGNYRTLVRLLARRRFVFVGSAANRRTLVFDQDVGRATLLAAFHPHAPGRIFNVTDGATHTVREIVDAICSALEREPPRVTLPLAPVRILLKGAFAVAPGLRPVRRAQAMVDKYLEHVAVDGGRIRSELGFRPRIELQEGWMQTVAGLRSTGDV